MNLLQMKYALEVAKAGSVNKAAETLYVAQPNISRSIKELEADLGIVIFDRRARGMVLTPEGEEFLGYARAILSQIDELEKHYKEGTVKKQKFSVSVPRSSYIGDAFVNFSRTLSVSPSEIFYKETNSLRAIKNILEADYKLGIIRYASSYDKYFREMLDEKGLKSELITEFHYVLVMSRESPLASLDEIGFEDLKPYIEIAHADPYVPNLSLADVRKEELPSDIDRRIFVFERASQDELLSGNPDTYMWVSPYPQATLDRFNLVQKECRDNKKLYRDLLIYKKDYRLSALDKEFITQVCLSKRRIIDKKQN